MESHNKMFDVALSFAGEDRAYVKEVADILHQMGIRVFYDKYETVSLWGKDLYEHLQETYYSNSRYVVMFLSKHYAQKIWTSHERKSAQAKAFESHKEYILPARFDNTEIPGILPTISYIDLNDYSPIEFAKLIKEKIGFLPRFEFFPFDLDVLYDHLEAEADQEKKDIFCFAGSFFDNLKLMTRKERLLVFDAVEHTCPAGPPDNVHLNIEFLSRISNLTTQEIKAIFARLDCLNFVTRIYKQEKHKDALCKAMNVIEIKYQPWLTGTDKENGTYVMVAIVEIFSSNLCPECRRNYFERLDFSILNSLTGTPE